MYCKMNDYIISMSEQSFNHCFNGTQMTELSSAGVGGEVGSTPHSGVVNKTILFTPIGEDWEQMELYH